MYRLITLIMAVCVPMVLAVGAVKADGEPSEGARGMPGAKGTFEYKPDDWRPATTWWLDTDGIDPETPGCHVGTDQSGKPNGRMFPEACRENGLLVESNPGASVLHSHTDDFGHPDTIDCNAWCKGIWRKSSKGDWWRYSGGVCTEAAAPPPCAGSAKTAKSAQCSCYFKDKP